MCSSKGLRSQSGRHADCKVFHCIDSDHLSQYASLMSLETAEEKTQALLQTYQQKAQAWHVSPDFSYEMGNPGQAICNVAHQWGADLIILGRRGNKGIAELLGGSVSNYVVHHAPCSVLVIQGKALIAESAATDSADSSQSVNPPSLSRSIK
ncbi:MAG: universal stress protein [Stenomitos frigidus ULC029]